MKVSEPFFQFKQITEQMHNCVIDCLRGERDDVVCNFNITMTKKDLYCLTGENWLNDKVEFEMIKQQMFKIFSQGAGVLLTNGGLPKMPGVPVPRGSTSPGALHVHILLPQPDHARVRGLHPAVEQGRRHLHLPHGPCSHTLAGALVSGNHRL